jgi:hypothetical protein
MIAMRRRGVKGGGGVKERGHKRGGGEARDLECDFAKNLAAVVPAWDGFAGTQRQICQ